MSRRRAVTASEGARTSTGAEPATGRPSVGRSRRDSNGGRRHAAQEAISSTTPYREDVADVRTLQEFLREPGPWEGGSERRRASAVQPLSPEGEQTLIEFLREHHNEMFQLAGGPSSGPQSDRPPSYSSYYSLPHRRTLSRQDASSTTGGTDAKGRPSLSTSFTIRPSSTIPTGSSGSINAEAAAFDSSSSRQPPPPSRAPFPPRSPPPQYRRSANVSSRRSSLPSPSSAPRQRSHRSSRSAAVHPSYPSPSGPVPRRDSEVLLPPWQPDSDVTHCPVCFRQFTFFYRKHHCRKCGRVVCANCSPHRITIPRQYIVHPPLDPSSVSEPSNMSANNNSNNGEGGSSSNPLNNPALGGGQVVRVCNPCVPDPNNSPPVLSPYAFPVPPGMRPGDSSYADYQARAFARGDLPYVPLPSGGAIRYSGYRAAGPDPVLVGEPMPPRRAPAPPAPPTRRPPSRSSDTANSFSNQVAPGATRPQPISEDDQCPICGRLLPPGPNDSPLRTEHISNCIESHSSSPGPVAPHLLPFEATERDEGKECVICLEEFEVGVGLARLGCWCVFHEGCIRDWWDVRGARVCPTHTGGGN